MLEATALLTAHSFFSCPQNAGKVAPLGGAFWEGGGSTFVNKGTNGRWKDVLPKEDSDKYEKMAEEILGKECAEYVMYGSTPPTTST